MHGLVFCRSWAGWFWLLQGERDRCADEVESLALFAGGLGEHGDVRVGIGEPDLVAGQRGQVAEQAAEAAVGAVGQVVPGGVLGLGGGRARFESILDALGSVLRFRQLLWHYRSRDERLIAFSNAHIYDRTLITFPGISGGRVLRYVPVAWQPGADANSPAPEALYDLGVVQQLAGDYPAAASLTQALDLFRDLGDRHGEAGASINLGELLFISSTYSEARSYFTKAFGIARDIDIPLEEARALEGIGRCHIQAGNPRQGAADLRRALTIYRRIGAPEAQRVETTLSHLAL